MWEFYLISAEMMFRTGSQLVFHMQLARKRDAAPIVRDYITDLQRALSGHRSRRSSLSRFLRARGISPGRIGKGRDVGHAGTGQDVDEPDLDHVEVPGVEGLKLRHWLHRAALQRGLIQHEIEQRFGGRIGFSRGASPVVAESLASATNCSAALVIEATLVSSSLGLLQPETKIRNAAATSHAWRTTIIRSPFEVQRPSSSRVSG